MARTRKQEDAIALLKKDHKEVQGLFKEFEQLEQDGSEAVEQIIVTACTELKIHDKLETEIFYPAIREQGGDEELNKMLNEAEVEHKGVRDLIKTIEGMSASDEKRTAHFTVLTEYVKHHVKEEEKEMFPKIQKLGIDLDALGEQLKSRKMELMGEQGMDVEADTEETA